MENNKALTIAWQRYGELDRNARRALSHHLQLRGWAIALSVIATLLAVLSTLFPAPTPTHTALRVGLILVPIIGAAVATFANKFQQGERWLALRTGAEEIKKDIYLYRTLLQKSEERDQWLIDRVALIQREVAETLGEELVLQEYTGPLPPTSGDDPGFHDLLPQDYLRYRLQRELAWHTTKTEQLQRNRLYFQAGVIAFGALGALLAALGGRLEIWVALTASLAAALTAWLELRRLDMVIRNYSRVILELKIIQDHWNSLSLEERTGDAFFKMVLTTEEVLWKQHSQYISQMREAIARLRGEEQSDTLSRAIEKPAHPAIDRAILEQEQAIAADLPLPAETAPPAEAEEEEVEPMKPSPREEKKPPRGAPHAFVVMPFGRKQGFDGQWIDFNSIYEDLIKPALIEAGFEPFRADEESVSGDILTDMFQELLLADLVIADLSIDNANVFYELGVRHAMRKRGIVHIQAGRAYMPFDVFNVRTIPYHVGPDGRPNPDHVEKDIQAIAKVTRETWLSERERVHSPIFNLLDGLNEPNRRALQTPLATGYWREYNEFQARVNMAQRQNQLGDILLLTEEVRNPLIREEAIAIAGKALRSAGNDALALRQYRHGLEINPKNAHFRREEAYHLARLNRFDEAIVRLEELLKDDPGDIEAMSYLGRIYKDMWVQEWQPLETKQARIKEAYEAAYMLKHAIDTYLEAYSLDQNHYYSGINALMLSALLNHLVEQVDENGSIEPEIGAEVQRQWPTLKGAVQFSLEQTARRNNNDYWTFASLGDMAVCVAEQPIQVTRAYKKALALGGKSRFAIQSTLRQLAMFETLDFRPEYIQAGRGVLEEALTAYADEAESEATDQSNVYLFSGHMIDHPDRSDPRFPPEMEQEAFQRIEKVLDKLHPVSGDITIAAGAACGGDILFIEACLKRDMRIEIYLPFDEAQFIEASVSFAGEEWVERFHAIRHHPNVTIHLQPERLGPVPEGDDPYSRNNRWALYSTLCYGIERVRLVVLWNGKGGDGPGGTAHMVREVRRLGGIVEHLDTTKFDYWQAKGKVGQMLDSLMTEE